MCCKVIVFLFILLLAISCTWVKIYKFYVMTSNGSLLIKIETLLSKISWALLHRVYHWAILLGDGLQRSTYWSVTYASPVLLIKVFYSHLSEIYKKYSTLNPIMKMIIFMLDARIVHVTLQLFMSFITNYWAMKLEIMMFILLP